MSTTTMAAPAGGYCLCRGRLRWKTRPGTLEPGGAGHDPPHSGAGLDTGVSELCGSHAGVSIGEDGPSHMTLEDLAMMQGVHGSTVVYPADANSGARLADRKGISSMRTTREKTLQVYEAAEPFPIGGSKTRHSRRCDRLH